MGEGGRRRKEFICSYTHIVDVLNIFTCSDLHMFMKIFSSLLVFVFTQKPVIANMEDPGEFYYWCTRMRTVSLQPNIIGNSISISKQVCVSSVHHTCLRDDSFYLWLVALL